MSETTQPSEFLSLSRREFLAATSTGLAALTTAGCGEGTNTGTVPMTGTVPIAPFDTLRDYVAALDAHGLLLRIPRIDQDLYEATGLFFRMTDRFGMYESPALLFDEVKIDGEWRQGPVLANIQGHWNTDCIVWGLDPVPGDHFASYRKAKAYMKEMLAANDGAYPKIPPVEVAQEKALCKQVVLTGDAIDLLQFPFLKTNPADGGRYVNTGSIFTSDPEMGSNFGTYRCQIKGPRKLGVNPEPNQTGWKMLMRARDRGEEIARVSIVLGQDPVMWMISGTRVEARRGKQPVDELAIAGGMRGKAIEVVKSETNDHLVPAHCEMVIEGEVPLQEPMLPEGPFGEMFGYLGQYKEENFWMNVTAVTHRKDPWFMNAFTGMQRGMITAPMDSLYDVFLKTRIPNLEEYHGPQYAMGVIFVSINKTAPGEGLEAGRKIAASNPIAKVVVVVDKDMNVLDKTQMLFAMGSRWQPHPATEIVEDAPGLFTDPSQPTYGRTSKIVIDATRQWPEEGGRQSFPETNRNLLIQGAPGIFADVDALYRETLESWPRV